MTKRNMFEKAAETREAEQQEIEAAAKAGKEAVAEGGQAASGSGQAGAARKATTILLDPEKRVAIRKLAADLDTNVSDLINLWIAEKCVKYL